MGIAISTQPLLDYILVRKTEAKNAQGLYLAAPADPAAPTAAEVLAIGPGRVSEYSSLKVPMPEIAVGDVIIMHGGGGIRVPSEGEKVYAIQPRDLIGKQVA